MAYREAHGQVERVAVQRDRALAVGNARRAALLASRAVRLEAEAADESQGQARGASERRRDAEVRGAGYTSFLDAQAEELHGRRHGEAFAGATRYAALAGLAGYGRREYAQLDTAKKQAARELIDRELMLRREAAGGGAFTRGARPSPDSGSEWSAGGIPLIPTRFDPGSARARPGSAGPSESVVMKDALEITARRRRQLREGRR